MKASFTANRSSLMFSKNNWDTLILLERRNTGALFYREPFLMLNSMIRCNVYPKILRDM